MKTTKILTILVLALGLMVCQAKVSEAAPMGTAFTYQGHLMDKNKPADGLYDLRFKLYDDPNVIDGDQVGDTLDINDLDVVKAYFTVELDFGSDVFDGNAVWLETGVRPGELEDPNVYTILEPRLELTPVPYALYAKNAGGDNDWMISDSNMYSIPSGNVGIGTNSPAAKLTVNGAILRDGSTMYGPNADTHINLGTNSTTGGSYPPPSPYATVGGGYDNTASGEDATVGGGYSNKAFGLHATIGGGYNNTACYPSSTVGGGYYNYANSDYATIGGGCNNNASESYATVSGGEDNIASGFGATVPGGMNNTADGSHSFAAGRQAKANHAGAFVWADSTAADFASTGNDQFLIRASGGVGIGTTSPEGKLEVSHDGTSHDLVVDYSSGNVGIGTTSPGAKLDVMGRIRISNAAGDPVVEMGEGLDYAEGFDVSDKSDIAGGTVLVIDSENPGKLAISDKPYDSRVAGIVAGAKGQGSGVRLGSDEFDYDVALAGRVYCNVDATEAAVQPGDLLTTSATPGYAMKATDYIRTQGAILGKAMEKLEKGKKGQILVLVTLQ